MMTKEEIKKAADEISSWLQDAAGDSAGYDLESCRTLAAFDDGRKEKIDKFLKDGVDPAFVSDCIADDLYDDVGWLQDMTGDRIHDKGKGNYANMIAIAKCVEESRYSHSALKTAMKSHIKRWEGYLEKQMQKEFDKKYPDGSCIDAMI